MKSLTFAFLAGLTFSLIGVGSAFGEVSVGDTREQVIETLGQPKGYIGSASHQVYYFDRGEVIFRNGLVQSHTLVSQAEAERQDARRAEYLAARDAAREAEQQRRAEAREERIAQGTEIRDQRRNDPMFAALPPAERLAFWQVFRQRYPEVDVDFELAVAMQQARAVHAEQQAELAREQRLRELEQRVVEAENQARLAEREAQRVRDRRYYDGYYGYGYPVVRHYPVIIRPCPTTGKQQPPKSPTGNVITEVRQVHEKIVPPAPTPMPPPSRQFAMREGARDLR